MLQIIIRDIVVDREIYDSVNDGHFDEKFKTLPFMVQKIFEAWEGNCYSFYSSHGEEHRDSLSFRFGGYEYIFSDLYWD